MNIKKITITLCLIIFSSFSYACSDIFYYDQSNFILSQYGVKDRYYNFQFDPTTTWYDYQQNIDRTKLNILAWEKLLNFKDQDSSLYRLIYETSASELEKSTSEAFQKINKANMKEYLLLTKIFHEISDQYNPWDEPTPEEQQKQKLLYAELESKIKSQIDHQNISKFSARWLYLLLRTTIAQDEYQRAQSYLTQYSESIQGDDLATDWCLGIAAGIEEHIGNQARAKVDFANLFGTSEDNFHAYFLSYKRNRIPIQQILKECRNDKEILNVYLCESFASERQNTDLFYLYLKNKDQLESNIFLAMWYREVHKIGDLIYNKESYSYRYSDEEYQNLMAELKPRALQLFKVGDIYLNSHGAEKASVAATLAAQAHAIGNITMRDLYYSLCKKYSTTDREMRQLDILTMIFDKKTEVNQWVSRTLKIIDKIDSNDVNNYHNINAQRYLIAEINRRMKVKKDFSSALLANLYLREKTNELYSFQMMKYGYEFPTITYDRPDNIFQNDVYDQDIEKASIETLKACRNSNHELKKRIKDVYTTDYFDYFIASKYMRSEKWDDALKIYKEMQGDLPNFKGIHPYSFLVRDYINYETLPANAITSIQILERASQLKSRITNKIASGKDYLDYGTLLFNLSAHGGNHYLMSNHYRQQAYTMKECKNYATVAYAIPYLKKAHALLKDPNDQAKAVYLLAKIWRANTVTKPSQNPYFTELRKYKGTLTYEKIYNECRTFR